jgi:formylglycine-generating enzyme required for sulfatase activity
MVFAGDAVCYRARQSEPICLGKTMSALTGLSEIVGFFSYSREDDEDSEGGLSRLRDRIQRELSSQLGRSRGDFRLWQDKAAIAHGTHWENEIKSAITDSIFFIPIITPRAIKSRHCAYEFELFLVREAELGRDDLVFPILYIPVPELEREESWREHAVLKIIGARQYLDWTDLRHHDASSVEVRTKVEQFCHNISNALRKQWLTPEDRRQRQELEARQRAEEEQQRAAADGAARRREKQEKKRAVAKAKAAQQAQQIRQTAAAKADAGAPGQDRPRSWHRTLLAAGALVAAVAVGAVVWMLVPKPHTAPSSQQQPTTAAGPAAQPRTQPQTTLKPMETFADCAGCPQMVALPPGQFMMGSSQADIDNGLARANEGPQHKVVIPQPFAVGRFEVTRDQFEAFVDATGYKFSNRCVTFENNTPQERSDRSFRNPGFTQTGTNPAVCIGWTDAKAYVAWLAQSTGKPYRLLSESEWEYASRAGSTLRYGFGDDATDLCQYANGADQSAKQAKLPSDYAYMACSDGYAHTAPVGSFKPNGWSLSDTLGNAWELTEDCYAADYTTMPADGSPREAADCPTRTARGGSWFSNASSLRPAVRAGANPDQRHDDLGFRVARSLTQ